MTITCPSCGHPNQAGDKFCSQCAAPLEGAQPTPAPATPSPAPTPQKAVASKKPQPKARRMFLLVGVLAFVPMIAIFAFGGGGGCTGSVEGTFQSTGQPFGDYSQTPTACFSGEHESFMGVWVAPELMSEGGSSGWKGGLKIVKSHLGPWEVYIESPTECQSFNCVIRQLDAEHCSTFDVNVSNTNTYINDIRVREGHLRLQCTTPEGGTVSANLTFSGCS